MDRKVSTQLEWLGRALSAIGESITQLQLDVAKMDARIVAIDGQLGALSRRLDSDASPGVDRPLQRDLELEREVFGRVGRRSLSCRGDKAHARTRKAGFHKQAAKKTGKPPGKLRR
jgi:hypothetical protein